ncbi:heparinase II/III family protein [Pelotomaculum isophthalicicum JI]|uniref:Heparinase II/III family protein n=1 Tax=Pelotomaculum isophthalicicum JI TaxID=947010 RepID=A0A9X4JSM0_9FIRM|nr:alginate lyase family protein [Pelotomaculum isophthalicicum]MDF9406789.1 heparinase II/III family protein [Pelotomaculum isophthalicicum JI]
MNLLNYCKKIVSLPPKVLAVKVVRLMKRRLMERRQRYFDQLCITFDKNIVKGKLYQYLTGISVSRLEPYRETVISLVELYLNHSFDLLGSGWVQVKHGMNCRGLENYRYEMSKAIFADKEGRWLEGRINTTNSKESQRIWSLVDDYYVPIDWHLDFKSGYRWDESTWYKDIRYGHKPGVDVKVPWELARMQHLPLFAWAYALQKNTARYGPTGQAEFLPPELYVREFRNQVLDFIASNPPRFGVNWHCTMDVAIRAANWLVAYDMLHAFGAKFDNEFLEVFQHSVYDHGRHIIDNLEYTPELHANHYLANITGLLFVAAYLPRTEETDRWLAFAVQELISEMDYQFNPDGSNFEASTSYHRLSTEMMLYGSILCVTLPPGKREALKNYETAGHKVRPRLKPYHEQLYNVDDPLLFPPWFWERLEKAAEFTLHITKPNGEVPQVGDNDNGRFLKIWPSYRKMTVREAVRKYKNLENYNNLPPDAVYWEENILDHRHITGVAGVLFRRSDLINLIEMSNPEVQLVQNWLRDIYVPSYHVDPGRPHPAAEGRTAGDCISLEACLEQLKSEYGEPVITFFGAERPGPPLTQDLEIISYPGFGFYLYRSQRLYLAVRCGSLGQKGNGGHAHNDQLSIELNIDGKDIIRDPGTYLYTPMPERRNHFRSTAAHFTPQVPGKEQNEWFPGMSGLFQLKDRARAECLYFNKDGFTGRHFGFGKCVTRLIMIEKEGVYIYDFNAFSPGETAKSYSNGYGLLIEKNN